MVKTEKIRARVDAWLKTDAEAVLRALGLTASDAIWSINASNFSCRPVHSSVPGSRVAATSAITSTYSRITSCRSLTSSRPPWMHPANRPIRSSANPLFSRPSSVGSTRGPHPEPRPSARREDAGEFRSRTSSSHKAKSVSSGQMYGIVRISPRH